MRKFKAPDGGIIQSTDGVFTQVFDKDGNLVDSHFESDEKTWYIDDFGGIMHPHEDDKRLAFSHPFNTAPANTIQVLKDCIACVDAAYESVTDGKYDKNYQLKADADKIIKHLESN